MYSNSFIYSRYFWYLRNYLNQPFCRSAVIYTWVERSLNSLFFLFVLGQKCFIQLSQERLYNMSNGILIWNWWRKKTLIISTSTLTHIISIYQQNTRIGCKIKEFLDTILCTIYLQHSTGNLHPGIKIHGHWIYVCVVFYADFI